MVKVAGAIEMDSTIISDSDQACLKRLIFIGSLCYKKSPFNFFFKFSVVAIYLLCAGKAFSKLTTYWYRYRSTIEKELRKKTTQPTVPISNQPLKLSATVARVYLGRKSCLYTIIPDWNVE